MGIARCVCRAWQRGREPDYFGDPVAADDADEVLIRWDSTMAEFASAYLHPAAGTGRAFSLNPNRFRPSRGSACIMGEQTATAERSLP